MTNTTPPNTDQPSPPTFLQGFWQDFLRPGISSIIRYIDSGLNWFFAITRDRARFRSTFFVLAGLLAWTWLAFNTQDYPVNPILPTGELISLLGGNDNLFLQLLIIPLIIIELGIKIFQFYFSIQVFRPVMIVFLTIFVTHRIASIYLSDIFELDNFNIAGKYIWKGAFSTQYERITIRDGDVIPEHKETPLYQIGGPGIAEVEVGNVAVFERMDGTPHIIPPRPIRPRGCLSRLAPVRIREIELDGFERFRQGLELRDLMLTDIDVEERTKDGIVIRAKDVKVMYRVFRPEEEKPSNRPDQLRRQYNYSEKSVLNLTYQRGKNWATGIRTSIGIELRKFIADRKLSEFLTISDQNGNLVYVPRPKITEGFFEFIRTKREIAEARGYEILWIDVGTWETDEKITGKHLEAWKQVTENRINTGEVALSKQFRVTRNRTILDLVQDVYFDPYHSMKVKEEKPEQIKKELVLSYVEKLREVLDSYDSTRMDDETRAIVEPEIQNLRDVYNHLRNLTLP
jgi:hypothetical protein